MNLLLRLVLVLLGLVFAASVAAAAAILFVIWGARAAWARLTGRPVAPFIVRVDPFGAFTGVVRRDGAMPRTAAARAGRREIADVTDVEPRPPAGEPGYRR